MFSLRNVSITEDHKHRECRSRLVIQRRVCTQVNQKGSELGADVGKYEARGLKYQGAKSKMHTLEPETRLLTLVWGLGGGGRGPTVPKVPGPPSLAA